MALTYFQQIRPIYYSSLATIAEARSQRCKYLNGLLFFLPPPPHPSHTHFPLGFSKPKYNRIPCNTSCLLRTAGTFSESLSHRVLQWELVRATCDERSITSAPSKAQNRGKDCNLNPSRSYSREWGGINGPTRCLMIRECR